MDRSGGFPRVQRHDDMVHNTGLHSNVYLRTSITVFGTVAAKSDPQSSLSFVVDNSISASYTPASDLTSDIHHEALWTSPTMSNASHTLVITQTAAQAEGVIFLDYFLYSTPSNAVRSYFIDDRDLRIKYSPAWRQFGSDPDFQHTSQGSTAAGDSFSLEFTGKGISLYGGINNGSVGEVLNASMVIDGGPPVFFVPPIQTAATTTNNLIFDSGALTDGNHTLVVTAENDHTVWADYLLVTPGTALAIAASASGSSQSSPSPSPSPSLSSSPATHSTPIAVIAGAAAAGLVLIALLVAAIFLLRRRKHRREDVPADLPPINALTPTPYTDFVTSGRTPLSASYGYSALAASSNPHLAASSSSSSGDTMAPRLMAGSLPSPNSKRALANAGSSVGADDDLEEPPPEYSEE
ncbi:hypothetical protein C8R44DRAFT_23082 [Mycena epipterygia]|nr:hypothetical protein C8R44DRAFT_23082 [Mycena epipterygia]